MLFGKADVLCRIKIVFDLLACSLKIIISLGLAGMRQTDKQDNQQNGSVPEIKAEAGNRDFLEPSLVSGSSEVTTQIYGLKFIFEHGEAKLFTGLPISFGRAEENDIVLVNETVSAHHALVYYDQKAKDICIVDLDSLNGVFIDGQPTCCNVLYDGVRINLGTATLVFRDTGFIYPF